MDLTKLYMEYLCHQSNDPSVLQEYLLIDRDVFGPFSVRESHWKKLDEGQDLKQVSTRLLSTNGHPGISVNEAKIKSGESPYEKYYRLQGVVETVTSGVAANGSS